MLNYSDAQMDDRQIRGRAHNHFSSAFPNVFISQHDTPDCRDWKKGLAGFLCPRWSCKVISQHRDEIP